MQDDDDDDWFPEDIHEAFKELRNRKVFDVSDMYTLADAWGWTWEKDYKNKAPIRWSQEWEVELAVKLMNKVIIVASLLSHQPFIMMYILDPYITFMFHKSFLYLNLLILLKFIKFITSG